MDRPPLRPGSYALRWRGLRLVTLSLELRQRLRSKRWYVALAVWTLVMMGIGALGLGPTLYSAQWEDIGPIAAMVFSPQMILVLFAMLLVVPALSAGSINGDRTAGTLATLQASLLSSHRDRAREAARRLPHRPRLPGPRPALAGADRAAGQHRSCGLVLRLLG